MLPLILYSYFACITPKNPPPSPKNISPKSEPITLQSPVHDTFLQGSWTNEITNTFPKNLTPNIIRQNAIDTIHALQATNQNYYIINVNSKPRSLKLLYELLKASVNTNITISVSINAGKQTHDDAILKIIKSINRLPKDLPPIRSIILHEANERYCNAWRNQYDAQGNIRFRCFDLAYLTENLPDHWL